MILPARHQKGFVLITGLVLLVVIAIAAITSVEITNLDYKMASNLAFKEQSFQASESGRAAAGDAVNQYAYDRSWDGLTLHSGVSFSSGFNPLAPNATTENLFSQSSLVKDIDFTIAKSTNTSPVDADVYILRSPNAVAAAGGGIQQLSGYKGAGKGIASSGSAIYFELRAKGMGSGSAQTTTASEYRTLIQ